MFFKKEWWKEAVGYQIYLKSFKDSNNDGIGDLNGIREKLDYLANLGVNLLWITPFYQSPMDDNGYDISDFCEVDPSFGTLTDFKNLVKEAHDKKIKIIIDFVMNHTSDEHPWFIESRKSLTNKFRDYYIWEKGKTNNLEPTNWASFFGGSCWEKDLNTNEYYMKIFSKKMPDLNYRNFEVRLKMKEVANFWLDLGVDGFRLDAVAHLGRSLILEDSSIDPNEKYQKDWRKFSNLEETFIYLNEFKEDVFSKRDIVTVGEVGGSATINEALKYSNLKDGSLKMVFNFDHIWSNNVKNITKKDQKVEVDLLNLKEIFNLWQTGLYGKAWQPIYWMNHDFPRLINQYGNINKRFLSGSMLATALYFMWGTPFIYQGEEIGMSNYPFKAVDDFNDVSDKKLFENKNLNEEDIFKQSLITRDNARVVISWDDTPYSGFSNVKPWFHVHPDYQTVNVKDNLENENSLLNFYKKVIKIRKSDDYLNTIVYGSYEQLLKSNENVYAYLRTNDKKVLVIVNFFDKETTINIENFKVKKTILSNYKDNKTLLVGLTLRPYEAMVLEVGD